MFNVSIKCYSRSKFCFSFYHSVETIDNIFLFNVEKTIEKSNREIKIIILFSVKENKKVSCVSWKTNR